MRPVTVEVRTYPSVGAEAEAIADALRREHLERDTPWGRMAVLVRSGVRSIPLLRRVLSAAGVPVEVAGDELPLAREPAVAPLLLALRCADALRTDAGTEAVVTEEVVRLLLTGPLVRCDPADAAPTRTRAAGPRACRTRRRSARGHPPATSGGRVDPRGGARSQAGARHARHAGLADPPARRPAGRRAGRC